MLSFLKAKGFSQLFMSHVGCPDMEPWGLLGALGNKRGEATSAQLLSAVPELLGYPQGIPPLPPCSTGFGEGFVGEHYSVPCFRVSGLALRLFNEAKLRSWHSLQIGGRAGQGRAKGSGLTCWAPVSCCASQLSSVAGGAAS